ncbi:DUF2073 domain-containing protein [Candidatus Woesearchaeota archaeon]|nr:DUF2073 domain-containing protein [Candidatus Woesearchaeota archaeon]
MLTLQFMPFDEIERLSSDKRVSKLLEIVKENKILLLEGRLKKEEEAELIKRTMETIDDDFKGIEIGVIYPKDKDVDFLNKIRENMINFLLGDRRGFTVMGPATIVKEIKQDPNKIQLFTTPNFPK